MDGGIGQRKAYFIVNPQAGGGRAGSWWRSVLPQLEASDVDFSWEYSACAHSAGEQVRRAVLEGGARAVMVVGGDGSLYDVVNGLIEQDALIAPDVVLGVCAQGSACDFVRTAAPGGSELIPLLRQGLISPIDIGRCELQEPERVIYYINSFDAGAGADVCVEVNAAGGRLKKLLRGKLAFLTSAMKVLAAYKYTLTTVETEQFTTEGEYIIIGVGNGRFCGGSMMLFPPARLDDGKLDLLLAERRGFLRVLQVFGKVYDGSFIHQEGISLHQVERVRLTSRRPLFIETDGEVTGTTPVDIRVLPGLLPLLRLE